MHPLQQAVFADMPSGLRLHAGPPALEPCLEILPPLFPPWLGTEHLKTENCVYSPPPGLAPRRL